MQMEQMELTSKDGRILTLLGEINAVVKGQSELLKENREDTKDILDRVARLEESTNRSLPRVDALDRSLQDHEHRIGSLEKYKAAHCDEHFRTKTTAGSRLWDLAKIFIGPIAAVLVAWLVALKGGCK